MSQTEVKLPKWLESRYSALWDAFGESSFRMDDATNVLEEKKKDSRDQIGVILSELRKNGWLEVEFDPDDARKRLYTLKSREKIISETLSFNNNKLTRGEIEVLLKRAADLIRTRVDYTFILILLFYKRISDKWETEYGNAYKEALEDGFSEKEARGEAKNSIYHDFDLPEEFLWEQIRKYPSKLSENFSESMKAIAEGNPELRDVFENIDFIRFASSRENAEILRQLVEIFSAKSLHHAAPDILGDSYEWILHYFAPQKAKEGEVYTPREVIKLLIEILDPKPEDSVHDPACGSGGMLITSYKHVMDEHGAEGAKKLFLFGQEANPKTLALSKMNLYIHDIRNAQLALGDTLLYPKFKEEGGLKKFDIVIANPPWNQDGYDENVLKKGEFWNKRFGYGFTPKQSADWAWIQHKIASAKEDGRVGVVIDNGCLFRGGKEKAIRKGVLDDCLVECIILLPEKLFYNTGAPGAIIIFNKNKPDKRNEGILFINASNEYEQHPEVRKLNRLGDKDIEKIVGAYREFKDMGDFTRVVSLEEIRENDYNLNVTLYVFPEEEIEEIDVAKEWEELKIIEKEITEVEERIEGYLEEIRIR